METKASLIKKYDTAILQQKGRGAVSSPT